MTTEKNEDGIHQYEHSSYCLSRLHCMLFVQIVSLQEHKFHGT